MELNVELCLNLALAILLVGIVAYYRLGSGGEASPQAQSAPEAKASSQDKAVPAAAARANARELTRAAVKKSDKVFLGVVKRYSQRNGMGFVACAPLREKYQVDVRIFSEEFEPLSLQVGDEVAFRISLGGRQLCSAQHPWATEVRRADAAEQAEARANGAAAERAA